MNPKTVYQKIKRICNDFYQQRCPQCHKELPDITLEMEEEICPCGYKFHRNENMNYIEEIEKIAKQGLQ